MKRTGYYILYILSSLLLLFASCEDMEESYEKYLDNRVYSPRVTNLEAQIGFKTVTLSWENPTGDIAHKIILEYDAQEIIFDELIDTTVVSDLEIKGYEMSVSTQDKYGNRSVPATIYVFPNGEE